MKDIRIISAESDASRTVRCEDAATIRDIFEMPEVQAYFEADDLDTLIDNFIAYNGAEVSEGLINILLSAVPDDGAELEFDLSATADEATAERGTGGAGRATVCTSGGLQSTVVDIIDGETTVRDAIFNDRIRARSGMNDTQLSSCVVLLNGENVCASALGSTVLHDGDTITLNARAASVKGL